MIVSDAGTIDAPLTEEGKVRVWLRWNVLGDAGPCPCHGETGGRAGHWADVDPSHPELGRLLSMDAVALPDPQTGELTPPPRAGRGGCGCS